ncbi:MAG: HlyC/CorC family transporter [Anaerolineales bacterium]|nr:HlyC/CorC family transporter [Anaerolineales bacterium]
MESTFTSDILRLIGVVILVLANGFFVAAEFSLVSVRKTRVEELLRQGTAGAAAVKRALEDPDRFIAATQLGITIASLGLGWLGEPALAHFIEPVVSLLPEAWVGVASHSLSAGLAFAVITFLHVVVGELMPKSIALQRPEATALVVARPTLLTELLFKPAIAALNGTGNFLLRLLGMRAASGHELVHSVEELKMLVQASGESGVLEVSERDMLDAVFDFGELTAHEVMVPRTEMLAVPADAPLEDLIQLAIKHPHTQYPVYEGDFDHILGVAHVKDLVRVQHGERRAATVRGLIREAHFVPDTLRLGALLQQFRAKRQHMAIVLDEYGGTAGLVTLDDLMSQIVGQVADPFDKSAPDIQRLPNGSALINGLAQIEAVNDTLGLALEDPHYATIAGYVLGRLGRMARVGDVVDAGGARLKVEALDGLRIARLSLTPVPPATGAAAPTDGAAQKSA